jgi:hypothetical protein
MSRPVLPVHSRLSKTTPRRRALPLALALALLAPVLAPRPAAAAFLDDLWAGMRLLWAEAGVQIDPGGRPAPEARGEASAIWAETSVQIDPSGLVTPPPTSTDGPDQP